jgi:hypothetical protein
MKTYVSSSHSSAGFVAALVVFVPLILVACPLGAVAIIAALTGASLLGALVASYVPKGPSASVRRRPRAVPSPAPARPVGVIPALSPARA